MSAPLEGGGSAVARALGLVCLGAAILLAPFGEAVPSAWLGLRIGLVVAGALLWWARPSLPSQRRSRRIRVGLAIAALFAWLAFEALSARTAAAPFAAWARVGDVFLVSLAFLTARWASRHGSGYAKALVLLVLIAATLPAIGAALELFGVLPNDGSGRASFPFDNANALAGLFDLTVPLAFAFLLFGRGIGRGGALVLAAALALAQGATFSRGAQLATAAACAILAVLWIGRSQGARRARRIGIAALLVLASAALATFLLISSPRLRGDVSSRLAQIVSTDDSSRLRNVVWQGALRLAQQHPLLGVGPGQVGNALVGTRPAQDQSAAERGLRSSIGHAHNDLLQVAAEAGVPAALAFALFWLTAIVNQFLGRGARPWRLGVAAGLIALVLHGMVDVNLSLVTAIGVLAAVCAGVTLDDSSDGEPRDRLREA